MPAPHLATYKSHVDPIEGLRGVATIFLVIFHLWVFFGKTIYITYAPLAIGFIFILSGFIMTRRYEASIAKRDISFKQFAIRRAVRLYPIYLLSIILFLVVNAVYIEPQNRGSGVDFGFGPALMWRVLLQLTMFTNIGGMTIPWNPAAWIVSVIWVVDILFFLVAWRLRRVNTLLWAVVFVACTVYLIDFSPKTLNLEEAWPPLFNPTIARGLLGFSMGALLFRFHHSLPRLSWTALHGMDIALIAAIFLLYSYYEASFIIGVGYIFLLVIFPPLIIMSLYQQSWINRFASFFIFRWLGRISYALYLLMLPLSFAYRNSDFIKNAGLASPSYEFYFVVLVVLAAVCAHWLVELPCRAFARRFTQD